METIHRLAADRVGWLEAEFARWGMARPADYFRRCYEAQARGEMVVLIAREEEELLGFLRVVWRPLYAPFRERGIPEIEDLIVAPARRRRGVASRLMQEAEEIVRARSSAIGIGVGLHPGYAAAQRLYVRRGYVPDGSPLTYRDEFVRERQQVTLDDELVMHLVKEL